MPQPQQGRIWTTTSTHTTAHGNARSLIRWARSGIKPATSWFLARFISATMGTPIFFISFRNIICSDVTSFSLDFANCIISSFFLISRSKTLRIFLILLIFSRSQLLVSLIFRLFFHFYFIDLYSNFNYFHSFAFSGFNLVFPHTSSLRSRLRSLIWEFLSFPMEAISAINFLISTDLVATHQFWYVVFSLLLSMKYFPIPLLIFNLTSQLFRSVLFSFKYLWIFQISFCY